MALFLLYENNSVPPHHGVRFIVPSFSYHDLIKVFRCVVVGKKAIVSCVFASPILILGIWGIALATVIASGVALLSVITYMVLTKDAGFIVIAKQAMIPISLIRPRIANQPEVVSIRAW